jgi:Zn/Cd-binding protein ZinT
LKKNKSNFFVIAIANDNEMREWVDEIERWMDYYRAKSRKTNLLDDLLVSTVV